MKTGRIFILGWSWVVVMGWRMVVLAQAPDTVWTRHFGGGGFDEGNSVVETPDGGYLVVGMTDSLGVNWRDIYLIKLNDTGDTLWTRTYGGNGGDIANSITTVTEGGYVIAGCTSAYGSWSDIYLLRIDELGDTLWTKTYGWSYSDCASAVQQTNDGGFVLVGSSYDSISEQSSVCIIKTGSSGDSLWTHIYGGFDYASDIRQTLNGEYFVVGGKYSTGSSPVSGYLLRLNSQGDSLWSRIYGDSCLSDFSSVEILEDGGLAMAGSIQLDEYGPWYYYLVRTNSIGDTIWTRRYGSLNYNLAYDLAQTVDGGFILVGYGWGNETSGRSDCYIVRTNSAGDTLWTCAYGYDGPSADFGKCVAVTSDGGYIIVGCLNLGMLDVDAYVIRMRPDIVGVGPKNKNNVANTYSLCPLYPNPFNSVATISYQVPVRGRVRVIIYNILGQEVTTVEDGVVNPGSYSVAWEPKELPSGIYFIRMEAAGFQKTQKVVLLK
jgi:hypothetical protein